MSHSGSTGAGASGKKVGDDNKKHNPLGFVNERRLTTRQQKVSYPLLPSDLSAVFANLPSVDQMDHGERQQTSAHRFGQECDHPGVRHDRQQVPG